MKNKFKKITSIFLVIAMFLSIVPNNVKAAVNDKKFLEYHITLYNGTSWNYTFSNDGEWLGTVNGNKTGNGNKTSKEYITATKSGKKVTITAKGTKNLSGDSQTQIIYMYKGNKTGAKANLARKIYVKVRKGVKPTIAGITHSTNSSAESYSNGLSGNVALYVGDRSTINVNTTGNYDTYSAVSSNNAGATLSSTSAKSFTVTGKQVGTYTLKVNVGSSYSDSGKLSVSTHTVTKSITVYVVKKPEIDILANGTSVTSLSIAKNDIVKISYRLSNVGSNVECDVDANVNDNSANYLDLEDDEDDDSSYILTSKDSLKKGTTAMFTFTLNISAGDSVSNSNGDQIIKKTVNVTLGKSTNNESSYIQLYCGNGLKCNDTIYLIHYLNVYPICAGATSFKYIVDDSDILALSNPIGTTDTKYKKALCPSKKGKTKLTIVATTTSGITRNKEYTVYSCDTVSALKANNVDVLKNEKGSTSFQGIASTNYFTKKYTNVVLPQYNITYKVDDPSIATIDNDGTVRGLKTGRTKVTMLLKQDFTTGVKNPTTGKIEIINYKDIQTSFYVDVHDLTERISFSTDEAKINIGKTYKQLPINEPLDGYTSTKYIWKSSNPNVASVDENGVVTGKQMGMVTITAITTDGSDESDEYTLYVKSEAPINIKVIAEKNSVKISWKNISNIDEYIIYRSNSINGYYSKIGNIKKNYYNDKTAQLGKTYYYKVRAVPQLDDEMISDMSKSSNKIKYIPSTPKIKKVKKIKSGYRVTLNGKKYTGFIIYAGKKSTTKNIVAIITGKSATISLKKGKKYYIRAKAYIKKNGKEIYSNFSKVKKYKAK